MIPPGTAAEFTSPSLATPSAGDVPAYELKFLLSEERAAEVEAWARSRLTPDPHGDPTLGGAYGTTSLYFDTPQLDVYYRTPSYRRRKFRVRRYGSAACAFLERKSKWGDRVEKRRAAVHEEELLLLAHPLTVAAWSGNWFHRRLLLRRLVPACKIAYQRTAYAGMQGGSPLRVTLDRRPRGTLATDWSLTPFEGGMPLLIGKLILELKFRGALPASFKELIADMRLSPSTVSKYRLCREAWGVPSPAREAYA